MLAQRVRFAGQLSRAQVERLGHQPALDEEEVACAIDRAGPDRADRRRVHGRQRPHVELRKARTDREEEKMLSVGKKRRPRMLRLGPLQLVTVVGVPPAADTFCRGPARDLSRMTPS